MALRSQVSDRLLPCLLDRLTDGAPRVSKPALDDRSISLSEYRASVLRDLSWLLNSGNHFDCSASPEYPNVRSSVLNYGVRNFAGVHISPETAMAVEQEIRQAIIDFEPRIERSSLVVRIVREEGEGEAQSGGMLKLEIRGRLWALPLPEELLIETQLEAETGKWDLQRR